MTYNDTSGLETAPGYDDAQALLSRYPTLDDNELATLKDWFDKRASAFEVASLASNPDLATNYSAYKADHVDRFDVRDWIVMILGVTIVLSVLGMIAVMA